MNSPQSFSSIQLSQLLEGVAQVTPEQDCLITGITDDSRSLQPGDLFIARSGSQDDGARYVASALERGAAALLVEDPQAIPESCGIPALVVSDLRSHLSKIAGRFYGEPAQQLRLIGITGTNGKTSSCTLIAQMLENAAVIGTRGYGPLATMKPIWQTTPGAVRLAQIMRELIDQGVETVAMEVSSHALDQQRVDGLQFDTAVYTGIGHDHLDYHGDMESYAAAKRKLFQRDGLQSALVNISDELGVAIADELRDRCGLLTYGTVQADLSVRVLSTTLEGMLIELRLRDETCRLKTPLIGEFNALNLLVVAGILLLTGATSEEIVNRLTRAVPVPGRMEKINEPGPTVAVAYAHHPDGLRSALAALRGTTANGQGRLWCLFGCGGERDQDKRAEMGEIASAMADVVVLTDDNPRHESPLAIVDDVVAGCADAAELHRIHDRRQAITFVLQQAANDDLVLIAGKGDEPDQLYAGGRWRFDDRRIARMAMGRRR
ncbi:MAG: UDP-N-acetylmuramoyl-L-alanyl-D-glutamate--2,6-diaminopimelate ligase [Gammaproteobacteria bacterium]